MIRSNAFEKIFARVFKKKFKAVDNYLGESSLTCKECQGMRIYYLFSSMSSNIQGGNTHQGSVAERSKALV